MKYIFVAAFISTLLGMLFFAWYHELILVCLDRQANVPSMRVTQQTVSLWYFKAPHWLKEQQPIIIESNDAISYIQKIIEQWLLALFNNALIAKKIALQSVAYSNSGFDVYISFDRSPFHQQQSTYQKIMLINALGKTLQENGIKAHRMYLLVQHAYLSDPHVLCNYGMPISGYPQQKLGTS